MDPLTRQARAVHCPACAARPERACREGGRFVEPHYARRVESAVLRRLLPDPQPQQDLMRLLMPPEREEPLVQTLRERMQRSPAEAAMLRLEELHALAPALLGAQRVRLLGEAPEQEQPTPDTLLLLCKASFFAPLVPPLPQVGMLVLTTRQQIDLEWFHRARRITRGRGGKWMVILGNGKAPLVVTRFAERSNTRGGQKSANEGLRSLLVLDRYDLLGWAMGLGPRNKVRLFEERGWGSI